MTLSMNKILNQRKFLREAEVEKIYGINRNTLLFDGGDYGIPFSVVGGQSSKRRI